MSLRLVLVRLGQRVDSNEHKAICRPAQGRAVKVLQIVIFQSQIVIV